MGMGIGNLRWNKERVPGRDVGEMASSQNLGSLYPSGTSSASNSVEDGVVCLLTCIGMWEERIMHKPVAGMLNY